MRTKLRFTVWTAPEQVQLNHNLVTSSRSAWRIMYASRPLSSTTAVRTYI